MQPVLGIANDAANTEDNREAFWAETMRIALQGENDPASLTEDEIRRICRLALVAMPKRAVLTQSAATAHGKVAAEDFTSSRRASLTPI